MRANTIKKKPNRSAIKVHDFSVDKLPRNSRTLRDFLRLDSETQEKAIGAIHTIGQHVINEIEPPQVAKKNNAMDAFVKSLVTVAPPSL